MVVTYCLQKKLQVSSGLGLGMDSWCLPPLPMINGVAVRFAESASNLGRQIAKVVGKLFAFRVCP